MSTTYFGTQINESPTIVLPAGAELTGVQCSALAIQDGKLVKPAKGANVIGIALRTMDDTIKAGEDVTVQIKDIGKWKAGGAIAVGDELTTDANGTAVKAEAGDFVTAIALTSAEEAGTLVQMQIIKAGHKPAEE